MASPRIWPFLWIVSLPVLCLASDNNHSSPTFQLWSTSLSAREQQLWQPATRDSRFSAVPHMSARACESSNPPEALATPDPLLDIADLGSKVTVSFIVGTDGKVHSPFILVSAGPNPDRTVLQTVRSWRYRPAQCNGAPTETEGKVEFSKR
jgi:TonB family protein